jgi:glyoxylase-like metal-dependent hydrolase (beta-lactamase superfamily II)
MLHTIDLHFLGHPHTIAAFLIETSEGPVLVETGPHSTLPNLEKGINKAGYALKDVRHVFLSHIHLDHAGAAWVFAEMGATVYLHPLGAPHFLNPEKLLASARMIYQDQMDSLWGQLMPISKERLRVVSHKERIVIGNTAFKALYTPGHAVHHIAWQMGNVLFSGDVAGVRIGESGIVLPPCPPPDIDVEAWRASIRLMKTKRFDSLFLTHFGQVNNVKEHLTELEGRLLNWANWIKPFFQNGADAQEVTPLFQAYVAKQLHEGGISGEGLQQYESANPAWMSVAGLMRYWKKRGG